MQKQQEELRASQAAQKRLGEQLERERQALAAAQREIAALRAGDAQSAPPSAAPVIGPPMLGAAVLGPRLSSTLASPFGATDRLPDAPPSPSPLLSFDGAFPAPLPVPAGPVATARTAAPAPLLALASHAPETTPSPAPPQAAAPGAAPRYSMVVIDANGKQSNVRAVFLPPLPIA